MTLYKLKLRARLAWWAFWNPDRLTMLHFNMLRDIKTFCERNRLAGISQMALHYNDGRIDAPNLYLDYLSRMPGTIENRAAL